MDVELRTRVLLSVQRALVGEITPEMRAVAVAYSPERVCIRVYADREVTAAVRDEFDASVVTQVVADFPNPDHGDPVIEYEIVRLDPHASVPTWGTVVFARASGAPS